MMMQKIISEKRGKNTRIFQSFLARETMRIRRVFSLKSLKVSLFFYTRRIFANIVCFPQLLTLSVCQKTYLWLRETRVPTYRALVMYVHIRRNVAITREVTILSYI